MSVLLSDVPAAHGVSIVRFQITDAMVARFAVLTGDRSSLHVNEAFARRSAYRRPVVHGMLPVGFIALALPDHPLGLRGFPTELTGRFAAPVYAGDRLRLTVTAVEAAADGPATRFQYQIANDDSGATVTDGTITLACGGAHPPRGTAVDQWDGAITPARDVNNATLEEIETGAIDRVDLRIGDAAVAEFADLLAQGTGDGDAATVIPDRLWVPNLLAMLTLSTSVGVSLPGASATFLEFSAKCPRPLALDEAYRLDGIVSHRSKATRIIKKDIRGTRSDGNRDEDVLTARVAALVNAQPRTTPTTHDLQAQAATDWGLRGKVALVTGASRGIGATTAQLLALCGAKVVVNYHRGADDAARIVEDIRRSGGEATAIGADVADAEQVRAMMERIAGEYGTLDVLINNAARDFRPTPFLELPWNEVQRDIEVIAKGAFLCCQHAIPMMLKAGGGKIINISTVATDDPPPNQTKYVMAKSALVGLTRSLSIEFASRNIQVNLVVPNFVETDFVAHIQEGFRKKLAQGTPMQRHASPVDVARAVVYLASSFSSFTTGQKLMVTGGGAPYA